VFSDYYSATPEPAFANIKLWSGLGSAIAFFLFPLISRDAMVIICGITTVGGYAGYLLSHVVHRFEKRKKAGLVDSDAKAPLLS